MTTVQLDTATAEIRQAFYAYESALTHNRIEEVNAFFFPSDKIARYGAKASEHQYGYDAIVQARLKRGPVYNPNRTLIHVHIQAVDINYGLAHAEYWSDGIHAIGRQSQTWLRTANGWKIVSAHVSFGG